MQKEELVQGIIESLAQIQRPAFNAGLKHYGLSHAQASMLYLLFYRQPASVKQIAEHLGISKSAVSQLVEPLAEKGLVSRQNDPRDRRVVHISLTKEGAQQLKRLAKHKFAGLRSALESLSGQELKTLYGLHIKMAGDARPGEAADD